MVDEEGSEDTDGLLVSVTAALEEEEGEEEGEEEEE